MAHFRLLSGLFVVVLALLGVSSRASATDLNGVTDGRGRLAIVVGNSRYVSARYQDLPNASNDAVKLSESLKRLNFEVATGINLTAAQFEDVLKRYEPKLSRYGAIVIFYGGHGVQVRGQNYLLPVDALDPDSVEKLTERAVPLNAILARFASRDRQTIIFLDACNDSPLGAGTVGDGLAKVEVTGNSFVAFATQPGNVTVDGKGENSPFTRALLQNVEVPGLSISDMMVRVRSETMKLTLGRQTPWDRSSLREPFYFAGQQVLDTRSVGTVPDRTREKANVR